MKIGFIGLGAMGTGIAHNLIKAGFELTVYNRTASRAEPLARAGAAVAISPEAAARGAAVVITMLADDKAVRDAVFGAESGPAGFIKSLPPGAVHISMSTISPKLSESLAEAHSAANQGYVAAPVFGRPEAAAAAKLWIVASGRTSDIDACRPVFDAVSQGLFEVGDRPSSANLVKVAGNFMIAAMLESIGEAVALTRKGGIDPDLFMKIMNSLFRSPVMENYGKVITAQRYEPAGFKLRLGLKDVRLALEAADHSEVPMPGASVIHDRFLSAINRGMGDLDWAALARVAAEDSGL